MSIGTRIIQVRNQRGLTQRELSERSGIASSYLSRIENRRLEPRPKTLRRIADALGIPVSDLFQEGPGQSSKVQCVITSSGTCIMDLLSSRRKQPTERGAEDYSPRQIKLLRMANYLVETGDTRLLDALDLLLGALLSTAGGSRASHGPSTPFST
ncbi:MAG TPA: helix-turn-helix domain-containing protein [Terriglobia bacterium]|nr:helix-turn-helix domain-containing protein [Terriglobia bacterium]